MVAIEWEAQAWLETHCHDCSQILSAYRFISLMRRPASLPVLYIDTYLPVIVWCLVRAIALTDARHA